ncbi:MAG: transcriptional repressor [Nitrospirae bacterium]|nr:MAG: transcriptional repressor [Nitrospirota bacterium]
MEHKIFQRFLVEKKLKLTKERIEVLNEVFSFHGHFGPEQLYIRLKSSGSKASRASVYRTVNLLVESGLVERVTRTDKGNIYEHTFGHSHHDHMVCISCNRVIEFYSENLEKLQEEICRKNVFSGTNHLLEIRGYCEACRQG